MTHKKKVMIRKRKENNSETKKLPQLGINIKSAMKLAGLAAIIGLIYCLGASFSSLIGV
jgi:hypothetical protein